MNLRSLGVTALTWMTVSTAYAAPVEISFPQDARGDFRQLTKDYDAALREFEAELARLEETDSAEAAQFAESWHPAPAFVELFAEAAEKYAGSDDAVQFLTWIVENDLMRGEDLGEGASAALDELMKQHAENEEFFSAVRYVGFRGSLYGEERVRAICERVIERAGGELRNAAYFARGVSRVGRQRTTDADAELARADFNTVIEHASEGSAVAKDARGYLFELENLRIGSQAPDIIERDLDGVEFKLSDYRGKVVVLDFWGDW